MRVAVLGVGDRGPGLLRLLADDPEAEPRWIWDRDHDRLAKYRWRYLAVRVTTRLGRVLDDPGVEAVIIATPAYTHYELAARALASGKHAFVQKPPGPASKHVDELAATAAYGGRVLMCGDTFLEVPDFIRTVRAYEDTGFHVNEMGLVERGDIPDQRPVRRDLAIV